MEKSLPIKLFIFFILILFISCKENIRYLESDKDSEAVYVIEKRNDIILISYEKKEDKKFNSHPLTLIKRGDDYWYVDSILNSYENEYVTLSNKKIPEHIFLSKTKNRTAREDEFSLINDSIFTYQSKDKFITKIKANEKPVNYYYYYDENFSIDSIVLIILEDTIVYKEN